MGGKDGNSEPACFCDCTRYSGRKRWDLYI